jgi:hypothetical protein
MTGGGSYARALAPCDGLLAEAPRQIAHLDRGERPELVQLGLLRVVGALILGGTAERVAGANVDRAAALGGGLGDAAHQANVDLLLGVGVHPLDRLQRLGVGVELLAGEQVLEHLRREGARGLRREREGGAAAIP